MKDGKNTDFLVQCCVLSFHQRGSYTPCYLFVTEERSYFPSAASVGKYENFCQYEQHERALTGTWTTIGDRVGLQTTWSERSVAFWKAFRHSVFWLYQCIVLYQNFFTKIAHHKNCLMAYLTQNAYELGPNGVTRSRNCAYQVYFNNKADWRWIHVLGDQLTGNYK